MKLKNKFLLSLFAVTSFLGMQSCKNDFTETVPTSAVSSETIYASTDNKAMAINGMYNFMNTNAYIDASTYGLQGQMMFMECMGDDMIFPSQASSTYISDLRWLNCINYSSQQVNFFFGFWYQMIKNSNILIKYGQNAPGSDAVRNQALAEAYAFRGLGLFIINEVYAKRYVKDGDNSGPGGVLRLDPDDYSPLKRASTEENYQQVWADLNKAESMLTGAPKLNIIHFNVNVIRGIQARVALTQGDWAKAASKANAARQGYTLMSNADYKAGFNDSTNKEWIWGAIMITPYVSAGASLFGYLGRNSTSANVKAGPKQVNSSLYNSFPATDVRVQVIDKPGTSNTLNLSSAYARFPYTSQKFYLKNPTTGEADVPYMRAAEMYLIEAEALARQGKETESKAVFKILETNRNPSYVLTTASGNDYIQQILLSRRIELWGEGFRWYDLKRLNLPLQRKQSDGFDPLIINNLWDVAADDLRWQWLLPVQETQTNPLATQNPLK